MFPAGRQVHEGSRRYSGSKSDAAESDASSPPASITGTANSVVPALPVADANPSTTDSTTDSVIHPPWEGDRRFMFPVAKEIHKPARRGSQSSEKSQEAVKTATAGSGSPPTGGMSGIAAAMSGRRRSSGIFSTLEATRTSEHEQRRQGWEDMKTPGGLGGFFSGFANKSGRKEGS